jgi:hypothetical protein
MLKRMSLILLIYLLCFLSLSACTTKRTDEAIMTKVTFFRFLNEPALSDKRVTTDFWSGKQMTELKTLRDPELQKVIKCFKERSITNVAYKDGPEYENPFFFNIHIQYNNNTEKWLNFWLGNEGGKSGGLDLTEKGTPFFMGADCTSIIRQIIL